MGFKNLLLNIKDKITDQISSLKVKLNESKSPPDPRDIIAEDIFPPFAETRAPPTLDLRIFLPPIRQQGEQGTCGAQTTAAMLEYVYSTQGNNEGNQHLSPQFIFNTRNYKNDITTPPCKGDWILGNQRPNRPDGMFGRNAMKIASKIGTPLETTFPYNDECKSIDQTCDDVVPPKSACQEAKIYRASGYARVRTVNGLKTALYKNGPCYLALPTFNSTSTFWKPSNAGETFQGGHAVTIVGYTADSFIIRNSWGSDWGDNGHTYIPFVDWGKVIQEEPIPWECWTFTTQAGQFFVGIFDLLTFSLFNIPEKQKQKLGIAITVAFVVTLALIITLTLLMINRKVK